MLIQKAFKYELKLPKSCRQKLERQLAFFAGCKRFVWNKALAMQKTRMENKEKIHTYTEIASELVLWKKAEETAFLANCHSQVLQQTLKQLDLAMRHAFHKTARQRFPQFKKKASMIAFYFHRVLKSMSKINAYICLKLAIYHL